MRRRLGLLMLWLLATVAATVVVWLGVRVVAGEVTGDPPVALAAAPSGAGAGTTAPVGPPTTPTTTVPIGPAAPVGPAPTAPEGPAGAAADAGTGTDEPPGPAPVVEAVVDTAPAVPAPPPETAPPAVAGPTTTANGQGGSVTVRQTATTVELVVATPRDGYATEVDKQGPAEVRVRFVSDGGTTEVRVLAGSQPAEVRESGGDQDDDASSEG